MNKVKFIGNYVNYQENKVMYSNKLHSNLDSVKCDLNFMISCFIQDNYGIFISDDFLFLQNPLNVNINITQSIAINESTNLVFIKNGLVIDVFLDKKEKGYIYGTSNVEHIHLYKFYIVKIYEQNEEEEQIPKFCDPSSLSNTYNQQKFNNIKKKLDDIDFDIDEEIEEIQQSDLKVDSQINAKVTQSNAQQDIQGDLIIELKKVLNLREKFKLD